MPSRLLPTSDIQSLDALRDALFQLEATSPEQPAVLSAKTQETLRRVYPLWREELKGRQSVVGLQTEATAAVEANKAKLRVLVSHFLQTLNMAIEREEPGFRAGDRTLYGLDASQTALPRMERETELLRVTENVIDGEAMRVKTGGPAIPMPLIGTIQALYRETLALLKSQHQQVAALDKESVDVLELRAAVAELVKDVWDELEFAYRKETPSAMRRRCRQWGVVYTRLAGETEDEAAATETSKDKEQDQAAPVAAARSGMAADASDVEARETLSA